MTLESSKILWNNEVKTCKSSYSSGISLLLSVSVKNQPRTEKKRSANTTKSHWIFSDIFSPLHCDYSPVTVLIEWFSEFLNLEHDLSLGNLSSNPPQQIPKKNETAFNPFFIKNLHFPTFKVLINTFILLLTIPGQFENRQNSVFCSLWAGWQSMKSSCNRCGFFETIRNFLKKWIFWEFIKK